MYYYILSIFPRVLNSRFDFQWKTLVKYFVDECFHIFLLYNIKISRYIILIVLHGKVREAVFCKFQQRHISASRMAQIVKVSRDRTP